LQPPTYNIVEETLDSGEVIKKNLGRFPCAAYEEQDNLSTYCVAMDATQEYFKLRQALNFLKTQMMTNVIQKMKTSDGQAPKEGAATFRQAIESADEYNADFSEMDNEIALARDVLDSALGAYNELQQALPLHFKYMDTITALEEYRDAIADVRREIDFYPMIFKDVTTNQCT
jgi:hypothetical protein